MRGVKTKKTKKTCGDCAVFQKRWADAESKAAESKAAAECTEKERLQADNLAHQAEMSALKQRCDDLGDTEWQRLREGDTRAASPADKRQLSIAHLQEDLWEQRGANKELRRLLGDALGIGDAK